MSAITSPKGFLASGIASGLKKSGNLDLALVFSETPAQFAGIYTTNLVKGHSLQRTIDLEKKSPITRGVVINAGNANACVGKKGYDDATEMAEGIAKHLNIKPDELLTCSTGVIGYALPLDKIHAHEKRLVETLSSSEKSGHDAMSAIMTTDIIPKESTRTFQMDGKNVTLSGMAKGSGMIHPNMATMISVITTDANINASLLKKLLKKAADVSFHRTTVDGDTSVCDTLLVLANGCSATKEITEGSSDYVLFENAFTEICIDLAKLLAKDGEGATKLVDIQVTGAATKEDAYKILLSVCRSPLCKTAFFGEDANLGRVITAAGYSGAYFDPEKASIYLNDLLTFENGCKLDFDEEKAGVIMAKPEFSLTISLGDGDCCDHMWTCDFSYDYVKINGSYRS